ncbi:MAG: phenylalanine--tRNA ligase subunit beta [Alphaproteobacteria bacterium]|nr:phenylalanine--tRNA ligase subunit beta [Alphaproteobacteria bacterium]
MKFTLNWLKDHLETDASLDQISATLTAIGLEVESITDHSKALKDFVVGEIVEAVPHPDADKLRYCDVNDGSQILKIVCGAPNARKGIKVVLAREGVFIPAANFTIKKTKIRGLESNGMLCSESELGLSEESDGIIELPADAKVGGAVTAALGVDDPMIEIAITPNRGDCLGVRGIARDLAAAGLGVLKPLLVEQEQGTYAPKITVNINVPEDCAKFVGCEIRGVTNGESPDWLKNRLKAIGLRPISALVDITNYISFNLGRPLHVYDIAKLQGNITVRHAQNGEKLKALNGKEYTLKAGMTVIADDARALGLAGVMGGEESGCTESTTDVFLEVALFNPINIAQTGRALSIDSDARYRFERHVDPAGVVTGAELAIRMITTLCGGEVSEWVVAGAQPKWQRSIAFRPSRVKTLGGIDVTEDHIKSVFNHLGITITGKKDDGTWLVQPPSWRPDIDGEADFVEEILRINGYDNIPTVSLPEAAEKPEFAPIDKASFVARRTLAGRGFHETHTFAFIQQDKAKHFAEHNPALVVANPISSELDYMRPSLLPNLLDAAVRNKARGFANLGLFEVGSQFAGIAPNQQRHVATGIRTGETAPKNTFKDNRAADVFDVKADALAVLAAAGMDASKVQVTANAPAWYHPGRSGTLSLGPKIILGYFGELHPLTIQAFGYKGNVVGFELFLDAIPPAKSKGSARPLLQASAYQAVERDFAFLTNDNVTSADIVKAIRASEQNLLRDVRLFDVYKGQGVEPGKQSVAVSVTLQANDRTLTDEEIEGVAKKIIDAAAKQFGGVLRG